MISEPVLNSLAEKSNTKHDEIIWQGIGIISFIACVLIFISISLSSWRRTEPITLNYFNSSNTIVTRQFDTTEYGLILVRFSGNDYVGKWSNFANAFCSQNTVKLLSCVTKENCNGLHKLHINKRCSAYKKLSIWGYFVLIFLILSSCVGLLAAAWIFVFGASQYVIQYIWIGTGLISLASIWFWVLISYYNFTLIQSNGQFPLPRLSHATYLSISGSTMLLLCGIVTSVLNYIRNKNEHEKKKAQLFMMALNNEAFPSYQANVKTKLPFSNFKTNTLNKQLPYPDPRNSIFCMDNNMPFSPVNMIKNPYRNKYYSYPYRMR